MSEVTIHKTVAAPIAPRGVSSSIRVKLFWLRCRLAMWFLADGLSRLLLLLALLAVFDIWLDWTFRMDVPQRAIMLVLMLGGLGWVAYWKLVRPFTKSLTDDALILEIEDANAQLGESLISSVQFSRMSDDQFRGVSKPLVEATIEQGNRAAEDVSFGRTMNGKWFLINLGLLLLGAFVVIVGVMGVARSEKLGIWFRRDVLLANEHWPQKVFLAVEGVNDDGTIVMLRNETTTQYVALEPQSEGSPSEVFLDIKQSRGDTSLTMHPVEDLGGTRFDAKFEDTIDEFQFRARWRDTPTPLLSFTLFGTQRNWFYPLFNDVSTDWVSVKLVDQPDVKTLQLKVTAPQYAGGATQTLPPGKGPYYLLKGSALDIEGVANKPLSKAELRFAGQLKAMSISGEDRISASIPAGELAPGKFSIYLTDRGGLAAKRPVSFAINIREDRPPRLRAELVGVTGMVVPKAIVPFKCRVTDEYGINDVFLNYLWQGIGQDAPSAAGDVRFDQLQDLLGDKQLSFEDAFDLESLQLPTGISLRFRLKATDNDDITPDKEPGETPEFLLRIVTEDELRTDLLRREKEQRQAFERLMKDQEELRTDTEALQATVAGSDDYNAEQKQELMKIQRQQKLIATNIANVARVMEGMMAEIFNNRLEDEGGPLERRLVRRIIDPMMELSDTAVPVAVQHLDRSRRLSAEAAERDQALGEAVEQQIKIIDSMREILIHMVKVEGYQEAVNLLYQIEKAQSEVREKTEEERQRRIRELLEKGGEAEPVTPNPDGEDGAEPKPPAADPKPE